LKKELLFAILMKAISLLSSFWLTAILVRTLTPEQYGIWATYFATITLLLTFDLGISNSYRNDITYAWINNSKQHAIKITNELFNINLIISALLLIMLLFFADSYEKISFIILGVVIFYFNTLNVFLLSTMRSGIIDLIQLLINIIFCSVIISGWFDEYISILYLSCTLIFINIIIRVSFNFFIFRKITPTIISFKTTLNNFKKKAIISLLFFLSQILFSIFLVIDRYLILYYCNSSQSGYYDIAYKLCSIYLIGSLVLIKPLWSRIALKPENSKRINLLYNLMLMILLILMSITSIYLNEIISLWVKITYRFSLLESSLILAFFFCIIAITKDCYIFNALHKLKIQVIGFFIAILGKMILFMILIYSYSVNISLVLISNLPLLILYFVFHFFSSKHLKEATYPNKDLM